jgi:abortive infection bacteriophage resistance protein
MQFTKPPTDLDQQVDRLIQRGMAVPDSEQAKHFLQHLNYYRISGYWLPLWLRRVSLAPTSSSTVPRLTVI